MKKLTKLKRKMKRRRNFFRFLLLLFLISLGIVLALKTDFFIIDNIKVVGNNKIEEDMLIETSSIKVGENIFKISIKSGEENIRKLPYTKEIKISRKFPRTINMEIVERKEIAQIKSISSFLLVDNEGNVLDLKDAESESLPIIIGLQIDKKSHGDNVFSEIESESEVQFISEGLDIGLLKKMEKIDMENNGDVKITLTNGISIAFGTLDNVIYKLNLLDGVLNRIKKEEIPCTMIFMNKGENPIIVIEEGG